MTFRILASQMEALGKQTSAAFCAMMADYLRDNFPAWARDYDPERLDSWLAAALDKAVSFGITTEPEVAQFMLLLTALGLDADERLPWVKEVLEDRSLAPLGKVRKFVAECEAHDMAVEQVLVYQNMRTSQDIEG